MEVGFRGIVPELGLDDGRALEVLGFHRLFHQLLDLWWLRQESRHSFEEARWKVAINSPSGLTVYAMWSKRWRRVFKGCRNR